MISKLIYRISTIGLTLRYWLTILCLMGLFLIGCLALGVGFILILLVWGVLFMGWMLGALLKHCLICMDRSERNEVLNAEGKRRGDFTEEELAEYGDYCINDVELDV